MSTSYCFLNVSFIQPDGLSIFGIMGHSIRQRPPYRCFRKSLSKCHLNNHLHIWFFQMCFGMSILHFYCLSSNFDHRNTSLISGIPSYWGNISAMHPIPIIIGVHELVEYQRPSMYLYICVCVCNKYPNFISQHTKRSNGMLDLRWTDGMVFLISGFFGTDLGFPGSWEKRFSPPFTTGKVNCCISWTLAGRWEIFMFYLIHQVFLNLQHFDSTMKPRFIA